jgi:tRNA threonylcarbamoyl adenosine modification protein YeaZ
MTEKKYGLAIHTSTQQLGLGLIDLLQATKKVEVWDLNRNMSTHLHQYLKDFLQGLNWSELDFISVAKGPGSFTSIRIGMVTARTLAQQLALPLFTFSSLAILAQHSIRETELIAVQLRAGKEQYYVAIYEKLPNQPHVTPVLTDRLMSFEAWQQTLAQLERNYSLIKDDAGLGQTVEGLLELSYQQWSRGDCPDWNQGLPFYLADAY